RSPQGDEVAFEARIAQNDLQRQAGYQAIHEELVKSTATLFLFPRAIYGAFHTCNVAAPLWIVWYQEDGTPLDAQRMLPGKTRPAALCDDVYAPRRRGSTGTRWRSAKSWPGSWDSVPGSSPSTGCASKR